MNKTPKLTDLKENEEKLRKQAKYLVRQKTSDILKKQTHLFMHEKGITKIVSSYRYLSITVDYPGVDIINFQSNIPQFALSIVVRTNNIKLYITSLSCPNFV